MHGDLGLGRVAISRCRGQCVVCSVAGLGCSRFGVVWGIARQCAGLGGTSMVTCADAGVRHGLLRRGD